MSFKIFIDIQSLSHPFEEVDIHQGRLMPFSGVVLLAGKRTFGGKNSIEVLDMHLPLCERLGERKCLEKAISRTGILMKRKQARIATKKNKKGLF